MKDACWEKMSDEELASEFWSIGQSNRYQFQYDFLRFILYHVKDLKKFLKKNVVDKGVKDKIMIEDQVIS